MNVNFADRFWATTALVKSLRKGKTMEIKIQIECQKCNFEWCYVFDTETRELNYDMGRMGSRSHYYDWETMQKFGKDGVPLNACHVCGDPGRPFSPEARALLNYLYRVIGNENHLEEYQATWEMLSNKKSERKNDEPD